jgi:hypothetical protein
MPVTKKAQAGFDLKKLEAMSPPFKVRIERKDRRTQKWMGIPLPQDIWSKEDVERIEQIVLNDIAGGGYYKGQILDTAGSVLEWEFAFAPDFFPEKIPQAMAGAVNPATNAAPIAGASPTTAQPPVAQPYQANPFAGPVSAPGMQFAPPYQSPMQNQNGQNSNPPAPPWGWNPWGMPAPWMQPAAQVHGYQAPPTSTPRNGAVQNKEVEELKLQIQNSEHRREREAQESAHRAALDNQAQQFREEMRQMREMLAAQKTRPEDDPMVQAMKAQMEEMKRQNEQLQAQREQDAAEQRHRESLQQMQQQQQQQLMQQQQMQQQQMETFRLLMEQQNKQDPVMPLILEQMRQQADAQRENSRIAADQARENARLAVEQPRTTVEMMEKLRAAGGSEQMIASMNSAYSGLLEQQRGIMEMVMQMGQGSTMENVLAAGKETLENYIGAKRDAELAKSRVAQAQAQERAVAAQAAAQAATAQASVYRYPDGSIKGQPPSDQAQLGSAEEVAAEVNDAEAAAEAAAGRVPPEADLFGVIYEEVQTLRSQVAAGNVAPKLVATAIVQAADMIQQQGVTVPVFALYADQRYAELIDYLLPGVPSDYAGE